MATKDTSHLVALQQGLNHEKARLAAASKPAEIAQRAVWVRQYEREIAAEYRFLGMESTVDEAMTAGELLAELMA